MKLFHSIKEVYINKTIQFKDKIWILSQEIYLCISWSPHGPYNLEILAPMCQYFGHGLMSTRKGGKGFCLWGHFTQPSVALIPTTLLHNRNKCLRNDRLLDRTDNSKHSSKIYTYKLFNFSNMDHKRIETNHCLIFIFLKWR